MNPMSEGVGMVAKFPEKISERHPIEAPGSTSWCERAIEIVRKNREGVYGPPTRNFDTIAKLWNAYLSVQPDLHFKNGQFTISTVAVAHLMILMKLARLGNDRFHEDSHIDIGGYLDCAEKCVKELKERAA